MTAESQEGNPLFWRAVLEYLNQALDHSAVKRPDMREVAGTGLLFVRNFQQRLIQQTDSLKEHLGFNPQEMPWLYLKALIHSGEAGRATTLNENISLPEWITGRVIIKLMQKVGAETEQEFTDTVGLEKKSVLPHALYKLRTTIEQSFGEPPSVTFKVSNAENKGFGLKVALPDEQEIEGYLETMKSFVQEYRGDLHSLKFQMTDLSPRAQAKPIEQKIKYHGNTGRYHFRSKPSRVLNDYLSVTIAPVPRHMRTDSVITIQRLDGQSPTMSFASKDIDRPKLVTLIERCLFPDDADPAELAARLQTTLKAHRSTHR